ncbi:hypothetical protein KTI07_04150 [Acinetobacter lwoffii]|uniref:hypothetical protein n=1 Tax=Acinetobacter lwoffii TaxID=28090 RepID=UPI0021CDC2AB|nr:hypothetical protein [Acinetobacter lwoffii]MCU4438716.1 hypothetical protein [Acinetobacter lwoffii]
MPTLANMELPRPRDWNEFEDICLSISKIRWQNPNFSRFGRQGQKQDGVDIYGKGLLGQFIGVQCKNTLMDSISINTVNKEIQKAERFIPQIAELYIATSSYPDVNIQRQVAKLSQQRIADGKFGVGLIFWSDIEQELSKDINELMRFYPQFFPIISPPISQGSINLRDRDIQCLEDLLNYIDLDEFHYDLEWGPKYIKANFIDHYNFIENIIHSPLFFINDQALHLKLLQWISKWTEMINLIRIAPYAFSPQKNELSFIMPLDFCRTPEENAIYENLEQLRKDFFRLLNEFCDFVRENYHEINLRETSRKARTLFNSL